MAQPGQIAPDATFMLMDGDTSKISDWRGRNLVVYFYPKDDTGGCTKQAQGFTTLMPAFNQIGVTVIGISKDTVGSHAKFIAKYDLAITLGSDSDGAACEAFGVWVEKSMYGRQYMGIERSTFLIDHGGTIVQIWRKVKVPGHAELVLEAARAIA